MSDLKILVCVKVVPKPEEIRVDPKTRWLIREGAQSEINPPDMNALELGLMLKDRYGGKVSILSMGPMLFEPLLRVGLMMGADHIYLLSDRSFGGADTLATTYTLMKGVEKIGDADLVVCGEESSDGATGQVPSGLAEWLSWPQITLVRDLHLDLEGRIARGQREMAAGYELLEAPLPIVVSVKTAALEPRFIDLRRKDWAAARERVTVWGKEDIDADQAYLGEAGSPTTVPGLKQAPVRARRREILTASLAEVSRTLVGIIEDNK
jgi:electron transfer flavoprotein beta subunit